MNCFNDDDYMLVEFTLEAIETLAYIAAECNADIKASSMSSLLIVLHNQLEQCSKRSKFVAKSVADAEAIIAESFVTDPSQ